MTDLSVLIPSRNEMFLNQTIQSVLSAIEADTEIIVVLDGESDSTSVERSLPVNPRLRLIGLEKSIGQRAATNLAAQMSDAKYVMKLDAHCSVGPAFDRIMLEDMQNDWTMIPKMYNLHAFDWVCQRCEARIYQGPRQPCKLCQSVMERDILWKAKPSPETTAMRFDRELRFKYWGRYKRRQHGDLVDTMSLLGACWLLTRERYHALNICDEGHGGWGQQGTEVACKTWLSGGRLVCTKKTWFAHMFRTQGKDFGFPYPMKGKDVKRARDYSRALWLEDNGWPLAIRSLSWLIEKFAPVPDWDKPVIVGNLTKGMIYYTDSQLDEDIALICQRQLDAARSSYELINIGLKPSLFGDKQIILNEPRGILTMFKQILAGLETATADVIFLTEHDILYHPSHFEFTPPRHDTFYYNQNRWMVDTEDGRTLFHYANSTSGLCAYRDLLIRHYRKRIKMVEKNGFSRRMGFEPGTHGRAERVDDYKCETWMSDGPNIDLRHDGNLTPTRWRKDQFRNQRYTRGWKEADGVPEWGITRGRMPEFLESAIIPGDDYGE